MKDNFNIIRQINERGITVFLVEQNVHQTLAISHYGYVLSKGRVVAAGTPVRARWPPGGARRLFCLKRQCRVRDSRA